MAPTPVGTEKKRKITKRSKIKIQKLEKREQRHVTFSKRRVGLINKASELSILCGAQIAVITQSPGEKVFAFGHPSPDAVIDRYLRGGAAVAGDHVALREIKERYADAVRELAAEEGRLQEANAWPELAAGGRFLWELSMEGMELEDLEQYAQSMEEMRSRVMELMEAGARSDGSASSSVVSPPCLSLAVSNGRAAISEEMVRRFVDSTPGTKGF